MANFNAAFEKTAVIEGGYVFDSDDAGGETYKGISRRFNPSWKGWDKIDEIKRKNSGKKKFDRIFDQDEDLQDIAEELFDTGLNIGVRRAVGFLQQGLNLLNRNKKNYTDIFEDGLFGRNTLKSLQAYLAVDDVSYLLKVMNILQGMHYIEYMRKNPAQEKYAQGWLKRVKL